MINFINGNKILKNEIKLKNSKLKIRNLIKIERKNKSISIMFPGQVKKNSFILF